MAKANMSLMRNPMPAQEPKVRACNFDEVALGYSEETAVDEAMSRSRMYADFERHAYESTCNLYKKEVN